MNGAESDFHGRNWAPETVGNVKKYELTDQTIQHCGRTLYRIRALVEIKSDEFVSVSVGEYGGYVETENNLSMGGSAWVAGDAKVYGNAQVYGDARVCGNAVVYGSAQLYESACVCDEVEIFGNAQLYGHVSVNGKARVYGNAQIYGIDIFITGCPQILW